MPFSGSQCGFRVHIKVGLPVSRCVVTSSFLLIPLAMAPYFVKNLVPRRETRALTRPLLTAVATITWVQWAMFFSGYVKNFLRKQ